MLNWKHCTNIPGSAALTVGLHGLGGLFQPKMIIYFCDSIA